MCNIMKYTGVVMNRCVKASNHCCRDGRDHLGLRTDAFDQETDEGFMKKPRKMIEETMMGGWECRTDVSYRGIDRGP